MRSGSSSHIVSLRSKFRKFWPSNYTFQSYHDDCRPSLNIPALCELIRASLSISDGDDDEERMLEGKGKKRAAPASPEKEAKRAKREAGQKETDKFNFDELEWKSDRNYPSAGGLTDSWRGLKYPGAPVEQTEEVPVFRHTMDISYTTEFPKSSNRIHYSDIYSDDDQAKRNGWTLEESNLRRAISHLTFPYEERSIDLGLVELRSCTGGHVVAETRIAKSNRTWLFLVPELDEDAANSWLHAFNSLEAVGRTRVSARLKLVIPPLDFAVQSEPQLPFSLFLEMDFHFVVPNIFISLDSNEPRKKVTDFENARHVALAHIFPLERSAVPSSFNGAIDIPFFYNVLQPARHLQLSNAMNAIQPEALEAKLLPFQRRSVAWLLAREGMAVSEDGTISAASPEETCFGFYGCIEESGHRFYYNHLTGAIAQHLPDEWVCDARGGILAEEPGLGKTVEIMALILLNPAPDTRNPSVVSWDPEAKLDVKSIKTTLIVTPPALASQWRDELERHAPTLKVLFYDGWQKVGVPVSEHDIEEAKKKAGKIKRKAKGKNKAVDDEEEIVDWCQYVHGFDIVITTYATFRNDLNVARAQSTRPRREGVVYSNIRVRSPLVMVEWYRVVMDEVQMAGGTKTEDMVSLIPRLSSFAVSGTPARAQPTDLYHVMKFLRIDIVMNSRIWNRLLQPENAALFTDLFQYYGVRTMKSKVKNELTIPQQTRYLVPIEMGKVERHVYDQMLESELQKLGLDSRGVATTDGWEIDVGVLRNAIRKLRGICTHPQVGQLQRQRQGDKLVKSGALKSMDDVLKAMQEQNWKNTMDDWKAKISSQIRSAQLTQLDDNNFKRHQEALDTLLAAEKDCDDLLNDLKQVIADHDVKGEILKQEAAKRRLAAEEQSSPGKGKGKERATSPALSEDSDYDGLSDDSDLPRTPAGKEHAAKRRALLSRLRESRLLMHRIKFLQGDAYHVLGRKAGEDGAYEAAEGLRRELLKNTEVEANRAMELLAKDPATKKITRKALMVPTPFLEEGSIRAELATEDANDLAENILNEQSKLLWDWRQRIHSLLTQKLNAGEEADGGEYQRSIEDQGEAEAYLQAYAALLADKRAALKDERTLLAQHDQREKRLRHTKAAMAAAQDAVEGLQEMVGEIKPEHEVLRSELTAKRKEILENLEGRAVRSILINFTNISARILKDDDPEKALIQESIRRLRRLVDEQNTLLNNLDTDLALFRKAFNQRILYFRQLQEISDSVAEPEFEEDTLAEALEACGMEHNDLGNKINTNRARQRYLENLAKHKEGDDMDEDEETCILCRCEFTQGYITQCAHVFCEPCLKQWLEKNYAAKTCPVCRVPISVDSMQRFSVHEPQNAPENPPKIVNGEVVPQSRRKIQYNLIKPEMFEDIQNMESYGDYGNKVQTLVRHLLYLRQRDPGAKSICFSAWADSLYILERALIENGIRCLRIDQNKRGETAVKRFQDDETIPVLLLHGERENAGLNVTCASRVFLLESVVHHGFEIQAIARIDRMGQSKPTEVYCYYAEETLEKNILDLAARKGLSLYTKDNSAGTVNVSSFFVDDNDKRVDSPSKKKAAQKGDFISKEDDMLAILFPHMYEDIEYLIDLTEEADVEMQEPDRAQNPHSVNAIAGPSRLAI